MTHDDVREPHTPATADPAAPSPSTTVAGTDPRAVPPEVTALEGTYRGEWTMFGLDGDGEIVPLSRWTDTVTARDATVEGGRAYVTGTDEMVFDGAGQPPRSYTMTEGYLLRDDGELGDYFVETFGQLTVFHRLGGDTWAYRATPSPQELAGLGFADALFAEHVLVKVVTRGEEGEVHRNSRLTTVQYRDASGEEHWRQFVSLHGQHRRVRS